MTTPKQAAALALAEAYCGWLDNADDWNDSAYLRAGMGDALDRYRQARAAPDAPDLTANVGDMLTSGKSTAVAVTLGVNRPHYVEAVFEHPIGIRFNGKERSDVEEYCISEGWVKVPAGRTLDRKGQALLIKLKGKVEAFYR